MDNFGNTVEVPLVKGAWKVQPNYPVRDGVIFKYCPPEQVASEMDRLVNMHAQHIVENVPTEVQAAWLHHRFTQIHPFQDGNGRVARAIASLVLVKEGLFPLVVTRDDKTVYLDSLEAADRGNLKPLVDLIAKLQIVQFRKASSISESVLAEEEVQAILGGLLKAADKIAADKLTSLRKVFNLAEAIEEDLKDRISALLPAVQEALKRVDPSANAFVSRSNSENDFYFRAQIIENARKNLKYFVDPTEYRSWIALNMRWTRRAQLVFAIHGIGKPFNGSLICAPFLEFKDLDEDGHTRTALIPIAEEGFVFFYNEEEDRLLLRFRSWRDMVIRIALKELTQGLR